MPAQSGRHDIQAYAGRGGITLNHHKSPFIEQTDIANIQIIQGDFEKKLKLQFAPGIKAGFPSPAEDYSHETLDFNRDLIRHPEATFYGKVEGDSMIEAGIYHLGDEGVQTLKEFLDEATKEWRTHRPWVMPMWMIRTAAWVFEKVSLLTGCRAPLTQDFITIGKVSYYGDTSRMREELLPELKYKTFREGTHTV